MALSRLMMAFREITAEMIGETMEIGQ